MDTPTKRRALQDDKYLHPKICFCPDLSSLDNDILAKFTVSEMLTYLPSDTDLDN